MSLFYVYIYYDPRPGKNEKPVYVGKGKDERKDSHWRGNSQNPMLRGLVKQCKELGIKPKIEVIDDLEDENQAFAHEMALIATFGRRDLGTGTLYNMTDGGEGSTGGRWKNSPETVAKRTQAIRGKKRTPETRALISQIQIGRKQTAESNEKRRQTILGQKRTLEQRQRMSEAQAGLFTEERRRQLSETRKGKPLSEEHRAALREGWKHRPPMSEETRKKIGDSQRGQKRSEETKLKLSLKAKEREARKRARAAR